MSRLDHFSSAFARAVVRSKEQKAKQHANVQQIQKVDGNYITTTAKTTTAKLSDEQYRTSLIAKAIAHIKQKGAM